MTQNEKLLRLIKYLLAENPRYSKVEIPIDIDERFNLYRSLVNVRMPEPVSDEYLSVEDEYLSKEINKKGITHLRRRELNTICRKLDITAYFHFCDLVGRQPDCCLKSKKYIRTLCLFGAKQFKMNRFFSEQGTKSKAY